MTNSILARDGSTGASVQQQVYQNADNTVLPVLSSVQKKWRTDFSNAQAVTDKWDITTTGSGMAYSVANSTLSITTGTTLDDQITFLSKEMFTVPIRAIVAVNLSQRIAGQSAFIEFVSVDDAGVPDGGSVMSWRLDGTSSTAASYEVSTGYNPRLVANAATIPTTAPGSTNTFSVVELEASVDENWFHTRTLDSGSQRANSYVRHQQIMNPDKNYKLRLRVVNRQSIEGVTGVVAGTGNAIRILRTAHGYTTGDNVTVSNVAGLTGTNFPWTGVVTVVDANNFELNGTSFAGSWFNNGWVSVTKNAAPASTTTVGFGFATIVDYAELVAEISAGRGSSATGQAISTNTVINSGSVGVAGTQSENSTTTVNPVLISGKGYSAAPTAITSGRAVSLLTTLWGALVNKPFSYPESDFQYASAAGGIVNTTDVTVKAANTTLRTYITGVSLLNTSATATEFVIKDGATINFRAMLPASMSTAMNVVFPTPLRGSVNTVCNVACITTGAAVYCNLQGYTAP